MRFQVSLVDHDRLGGGARGSQPLHHADEDTPFAPRIRVIIERSIRPLTINWKNALFAGSDDDGGNWTVIASLIETAKLNRVAP
jgi:hypothetical protein